MWGAGDGEGKGGGEEGGRRDSVSDLLLDHNSEETFRQQC